MLSSGVASVLSGDDIARFHRGGGTVGFLSFSARMRIMQFSSSALLSAATRALQTLCYDRENVLPVIDAGALGRRTRHAMG